MLFEAKYNITSEHMLAGIISAEKGRPCRTPALSNVCLLVPVFRYGQSPDGSIP
jgi:hypothetical protein